MIGGEVMLRLATRLFGRNQNYQWFAQAQRHLELSVVLPRNKWSTQVDPTNLYPYCTLDLRIQQRVN